MKLVSQSLYFLWLVLTIVLLSPAAIVAIPGIAVFAIGVAVADGWRIGRDGDLSAKVPV